MAIAKGIFKQVRYKKESTFATAPGASGAQLLRRTTSDLDLVKQTYSAGEIRTDQQRADFRHGVRNVAGSINGELSPKTYWDFFASLMRGTPATATTTGAIVTVTATTGAPHFVRSSGSFLSDGFKIGDVVRWSGFTAGGVGNNARNYRITALTATQMTVKDLTGNTSTVSAKTSGDSVTCVTVGKKVFTPQSSLLDESYYLEHWYPDVAQSEQFSGCKPSSAAINLPASGMATANFQFMGKDIVTNTSQYYTSPTAATTSGVLAAVNGILSVGGTDYVTVTGASLNINGDMSIEPVVGSNSSPDIFPGVLTVSGQLTAFFEDATLRDLFLNETEAALHMVFTTSNAANADFISFSMPRIKTGGASKSDGLKGLIQTIPFEALLNINGGAGVNSDLTTLIIQDSLAP